METPTTATPDASGHGNGGSNTNTNGKTSTNSTNNNSLLGKAGVCSLDVQSVEFNWRNPWQRLEQSTSYGTGFVIDGHRILTNAHVVSAAIDVRVRLLSTPKQYKARVEIYAPDVDLAILKLDDVNEESKFFYDNNGISIALEFAPELPHLQDHVHVTGYPTGGTTVCATEGVVSRIDLRCISADWRTYVLCIQIDAAINSGNSGGPVFDKTGRVAGVAFRKRVVKGTDNIGYIISASTVRAFLSRCHDDGTYTLAYSAPYYSCSMFNRSQRLAHNVPEGVDGVLITSVSGTIGDHIQKGDILTKVDDYQLASDGQVYFRNEEMIGHTFVYAGKCFNEPVVFTVYRNGQYITSPPVVLQHIPYLYTLYPSVDHLPEYLFIGPALFVPCSYGIIYQRTEPQTLLKGSIEASSRQWQNEWPDGQEQIVLLIKMMAHDESFDISYPWSRVSSYNGIKVKSLRHLRDLWEATRAEVVLHDDDEVVVNVQDKDTAAETTAATTTQCATEATTTTTPAAEATTTAAPHQTQHKFAKIGLEHQTDLVFEVKGAIKAEEDVMRDHKISERFVILPSNPKYRLTRTDGGGGSAPAVAPADSSSS
jgi:S1-C subfamily serine protease